MIKGGIFILMKIGKFFVNLALWFLGALRLGALGVASFFKLLYWPIHRIFKLFYFVLVLPAYRLYWLASKRSGFGRSSRQRFFSLVLHNKRLINILVIVSALFFVYNNLTSASNDLSSEEVVGGTMLAKLVSDEFMSADSLIEETRDSSGQTAKSYVDGRLISKINPSINTNTANPEDEEEEKPDNTQVAESGEKTVPERTSPIEYEVQNGDTLSTIARRFGISVNTIQWANDLTKLHYIRPGDKLVILPSSGVMHSVVRGESLKSIAKKYDVSEKEILTYNRLANANQIRIGQKLIIPGGSPLSETVASTRPSTSGNKIVSNGNGSREAASTKNLIQPRPSAKPVYGTKMNWPTVGTRITQYYSWRHNGLDIANKVGTPIYAVDAGTVELVGYNRGGYGNQIVINHGGGKKTRYAHLSAFGVKVGQEVDKGEYIAAMGSTGRSTGPHIHFEVMIDGKRYNPLNYVAY